MEKESKSGGGIPSGGIIAIVMLAAGVLFIREVPLETTRLPVNEPHIQHASTMQDVDARLWQDPFSAVARTREEAQKRDPVQAKAAALMRTPDQLLDDMARRQVKAKRKVEVLAVMLPGGPYSEDIESRRRLRYAVLAGLNASRLVPFDADHLGYFLPTGGDKPDTMLPEIVPYEWFEPERETRSSPSAAEKDTRPLVLVMWLDGDVFKDEPLHKMGELAGKFEAQSASWRVLGPPSSDGLRAMVNEVREVQRPGGAALLPAKPSLRFYSAMATTPDKLIDDKLAGETLHDFLDRNKVDLVRTIGDDDQLAKALTDELELRGLHAGKRAKGEKTCDLDKVGPQTPSHIGVISEWDTLYGRTLRREFRAAPDDEGFCLHRSSYVRGLDGQLPAAGGAETSAVKASSGKSGTDGKDDSHRRDGTYIEIAEGQSQFDYLRRLALRLAEQDRELRANSPDGKGLRAIGVLGSDVHDKLLVLQALKPEFPNAIFFTTDMDARFLHPREKAWTRNLIVASHFGLRLSDRMQADMPPFRDSYQTSVFLATRLAMDDAKRASALEQSTDSATSQKTIALWFKKPRLFEIGRTQAFDFSQAPQLAPLPAPVPIPAPLRPVAAVPAAANTPSAVDRVARIACEGPHWSGCGGTHPAPSPLYPRLRMATLVFIASPLILMLWLPPILISRAARKWLANRHWAGLAAVAALAHVALPLLLARHWDLFATTLTRNGKPLVSLEGISIWPTEAIRLFTLVLCLYLVFAGWTALGQNLDDIILRFRLGCTRTQLLAEQREAERHLPRWIRFINMFSLRLIFPSGTNQTSATGLQANTVEFWRRYIIQNRISARAARTVTCVLLAFGFSLFLWKALHDPWVIPQRGHLSLTVHQWLHTLMFIAIYFLVFFVVDATAFCVSFVRGLQQHACTWPVATLVKFEHELQIPRDYLNNWIDLDFIAQRTKCVTRLIYFPFIVLSLFLFSRSTAFDGWYMPATGIVLALLGASVALACAVALRYATEASRHRAMKQLRDDIIRVSSKAPVASVLSSEPPDPADYVRPADPPKPAQLTLLLERMEHLHEGAFAPFWQQPLLKASLLPFATLGGTSLLDYMALVNI